MLSAGTLYGAISNLLEKGWIAPCGESSDTDGRRKMYRITELGQEVLKAEYNRLKELVENEEYGIVLRSKGMIPADDGTWIYFDYVDGDFELRSGQPDVTGRIVVIGSGLNEEKISELFGL